MANTANNTSFQSLNSQSVDVLRKEIIDALSLTNDKVKLVMCLKMLSDGEQSTDMPDSYLEQFASSFPREVLQSCVKMGIEDYKMGRCIPHDELMAQIRAKRGWK